MLDISRMKNIPPELNEFLATASPRTFEFENGEVSRAVFKTVEDLSIGVFDVDSCELFLNGLLEEDPEDRAGFEGLSLLSEAGGYDADGVLVWFTNLKAFGAWDCDHHQIMIFEDADWPKIENSLVHYLNAQWHPDQVPHRKLNPWILANNSK